MSEAAFVIADTVVYTGFAIVFIVGTLLAYFVISLIGGS
jgi:Na+-transporting methylmalonyl-CoA/oxaloacetate decarboxylase gamma subunit